MFWHMENVTKRYALCLSESDNPDQFDQLTQRKKYISTWAKHQLFDI